MRTSFYLSATLLAAALFVGCAEDPVNEMDPATRPVTTGFELTAAIEPLTKTALNDASTIVWREGDRISGWIANDASNANVEMALTASGKDQTIGVFSGALSPQDETFSFYALYPYDASYGNDPTGISLDIPATVDRQTDVNGVIGVSDFMFAKATLSQNDVEHSISFTHPLSLLNIVIDGSNSIFSDAVIESLTITANRSFVGSATCDLSNGNLSATDAEAGKSLVINYPADAAMNTPQNAWVAVLPVDLTDGECSFTLRMTNGQQVVFNVNPTAAFSPQTKYTLTFSDIDAWIEKGRADVVPYDLVAAGGRANCYIITNGGNYQFAADYANNAHEYEFVGITDADWLWSTGSESLLSDVTYSTTTKRIYFAVRPGSNGNAVIAARNAAGEIVWSWHIWLTVDDPRTEPTHWSRNDAWLLMNRNLGATSSQEGDLNSYGLYWQWGRKDPFPGSSTLGNVSNTGRVESTAFTGSTAAYVINPVFSDRTFSSVRNTSVGESDIAYAIANPTTFIHYYQAGSAGMTNTWLYTSTLEEAQQLWNSSKNRSEKTIYDPCPAGWCVPVNNGYAWQNYWNSTYVTFENNSTVSGVVYRQADDNTSYYPAAGYRNAGQLSGVGYAAFYWAANTRFDTSNQSFLAYAMNCYGRGTIRNSAQSYTATAYSIRCMKQ